MATRIIRRSRPPVDVFVSTGIDRPTLVERVRRAAQVCPGLTDVQLIARYCSLNPSTNRRAVREAVREVLCN